MLLVLMGPSGAGKSTIENTLHQNRFGKLISCTTRNKRDNESENAYFFMSVEEFSNHVKSGNILEKDYYNGNYYGLLKKHTIDVLNTHVHTCFVATYPGYEQLSAALTNIKIIPLWITADFEVLKQRMLKRGDSLKSVEDRLKKDFEREQRIKSNIDYVHAVIDTTNNTKEETLEKVKGIVVTNTLI
jgi:guanylate kinase